jgi:putative transposase
MKTTRHATYNLNYHIVWLPKSGGIEDSADLAERSSTQYRNVVLTGEGADRVESILHEIADEKGLDIQNLTVQPDHVHLFVSSPPKHSPSLLANWFKGISLRKYNHRHADHDGEKIRWERGYYAGTAGDVSSETVENYIDRHKEANA